MLFTGGIVSLKASNSKWEYAQRRDRGHLKELMFLLKAEKVPDLATVFPLLNADPPPDLKYFLFLCEL